jgi:hypothetical protein
VCAARESERFAHAHPAGGVRRRAALSLAAAASDSAGERFGGEQSWLATRLLWQQDVIQMASA